MITLLNKFDDNYIIKKEDVLEIVDKYARDENVSNNIKDVLLINDEKSSYDTDNSILKINIDNINDYSYETLKTLKKEYSIDDKYDSYFINYLYLYNIYFYLNHVKQKSMYEDKEDITGYLYDLCNNIKADNNTNNLLSMNIEASNNSLLTAYNLMNHTKLPSKEANIMHLKYLKSLLLNYNRRNNYQVTSPIELLNDSFPVIDIDKVNELLDNSKLSKIERIDLGLPITTKEYDSIQNEINKKLIKKTH